MQHVSKIPACFFLAVGFLVCSSGELGAQPAPPAVDRERRPQRPDSGDDVCSGIVAQFLLNPRGEADGLFLTDETQIHFPPHMSSELIRAIKVGDHITARGLRQSGKVFTACEITGSKSKVAIADIGGPPPPPLPPPLPATSLASVPPSPPLPPQRLRPRPEALKPMRAEAPVKALLYGPQGDVNGFILSDQTIVRMPPETAFRFSNVFQPGQSLSVSGNGTETAIGRCIEAANIGTAGRPMISIYDNEPVKEPSRQPLP